MRSFAEIRAIAASRKGGEAALADLMPSMKSTNDLANVPDDRWLSIFTRCVFQAGLNWKVVENKWPEIEQAFAGFDPRRWSMMSDDDLDRLLSDRRVIRSAPKLRAVGENAGFLCALASEHGSAARAFAEWPMDDFVGLLDLMKSRGSRLGGSTGQYSMRMLGRDGFVLSKDVVAALVREGVVDKAATSKRDMRATQDAFNGWRAESGAPLAHISRTLALSIES